MSSIEILTTVDAVIEQLGGNVAVQKMTGLTTYQAVWDWKKRGQMSSKFYCLMTERLNQHGLQALPSLWGMIEETADGDQ